MSLLATEEIALLEALKSEQAARERIRASEQMPVHDPAKYTFPIGINDAGAPFPASDPNH